MPNKNLFLLRRKDKTTTDNKNRPINLMAMPVLKAKNTIKGYAIINAPIKILIIGVNNFFNCIYDVL